MGRSRHLLVLALVVLPSCGTTSSPTAIPSGVWGNTALEMDVSATGASLTFCCAVGKIPPPLTLDASGHFDLAGTYTYQAGPVRIGGASPEPARYTGSVNGSSLTITVSTAGFSADTFTLTFGVQGPDNCVCPL